MSDNTWGDAARDRLEALVPGAVERVVDDRGELTFHIPRDRVAKAALEAPSTLELKGLMR